MRTPEGLREDFWRDCLTLNSNLQFFFIIISYQVKHVKQYIYRHCFQIQEQHHSAGAGRWFQELNQAQNIQKNQASALNFDQEV